MHMQMVNLTFKLNSNVFLDVRIGPSFHWQQEQHSLGTIIMLFWSNQPTQTSDHYFLTCHPCPSVHKTKQFLSEKCVCYWRDCAGRGDHWWHLSCFLFVSQCESYQLLWKSVATFSFCIDGATSTPDGLNFFCPCWSCRS